MGFTDRDIYSIWRIEGSSGNYVIEKFLAGITRRSSREAA